MITIIEAGLSFRCLDPNNEDPDKWKALEWSASGVDYKQADDGVQLALKPGQHVQMRDNKHNEFGIDSVQLPNGAVCTEVKYQQREVVYWGRFSHFAPAVVEFKLEGPGALLDIHVHGAAVKISNQVDPIA